MKHNRAAAILIMLFSLMAALPVRAEETVKLTVITGIPGTRVAAYAVEPAPGTDLSDGESLRTLSETLEESVRLTGTKPAEESRTGSREEAGLALRRNEYYLILAEDLRGERDTVRFLPAVISTGTEGEMVLHLKKETGRAEAPDTDRGGGSEKVTGRKQTADAPESTSPALPVRGILGAERMKKAEEGVLGGNRKLPQTGQLWWPVPLLLLSAFLLTGWNLLDGRRAALAAQKTADVVERAVSSNPGDGEEKNGSPSDIPAYWTNPEMPMPAVVLDGERYIGILRIPALSLELPVMENWSYPGLRTAPCRYSGSAYLDTMIICGHNYPGHFGKLPELRGGAEISFSDMDGNEFRYVVYGMEVLTAESAEIIREAKGGDLTLFTCTPGGKSRYALFCRRLRMVE